MRWCAFILIFVVPLGFLLNNLGIGWIMRCDHKNPTITRDAVADGTDVSTVTYISD